MIEKRGLLNAIQEINMTRFSFGFRSGGDGEVKGEGRHLSF